MPTAVTPEAPGNPAMTCERSKIDADQTNEEV